MSEDEVILAVLAEAKKLAQEYRRLTGKPLGITGEVAEYEAARILGVELTPARQAGYDAVEKMDGRIRRLQIKGRCLLENCKPGQRLGSIRVEKEWDAVLMVHSRSRYSRRIGQLLCQCWRHPDRRRGMSAGPWLSASSRRSASCAGGGQPFNFGMQPTAFGRG